MKRLLFYFTLVLATLALSSLSTQARIWIVRPDGQGDLPTIQAAINAASNGDTILLTEGVFRGNGNRRMSIESKNITIRSETGNPETCIIDCEGNPENEQFGFRLYNYHPLGIVIEGITISNAWAIIHGGGISWPAGTSPLTVRNCVFLENTAYLGGAIDVGQSGAGTFIVIDCDFIGNLANQCGGAVRVHEVGHVKMTNCFFMGNAAASGGGVCVRETVNDTILYCTFLNNAATGNAGYGGGIQFKVNATGIVDHCVFIGNNAKFGGGVNSLDSSPIIRSCTFYGNRAEDDGAGVRSSASLGVSHVTISKTIVAFGLKGGGVTCNTISTATLDACDVFGNAGGNWTGCIAGQLGINGNMFKPPLFCDAANRDLRLDKNSPCLPENNPTNVPIGAFGRGCPDITGIGDEEWAAGELRLERIYPNPFNPATRIEYSIPAAGPVRVAIYDVRGHLTRVLVDDVQTTGEHEILWWGRDDSGAVIPSGIYFVRLEFAGDTKTRKLVFLK